MRINTTGIENLSLVESESFRDQRGFFYRAFCDQALSALLQGRPIRQVNISRTEAVGALRGLHFQHPPAAEMKLVRCLRGRVWDVAVDLRSGSETFLQWFGTEISDESPLMIVIPEGCAHGFQVLEPGSELLYLHTAPYTPELEGGIRYDDPALDIEWPKSAADLSRRDRMHPLLTDDFEGITI